MSPRWILADTDIFSAAPSRLTASGVSDFLGKYISILDWKIAHLVTGEYICEEVCDLLEKALRDVSRVLEDIRFGDKDAIEKLMYALLLSGLCMQMVESPRPVSGAVRPPDPDHRHGGRLSVAQRSVALGRRRFGLMFVYEKKLQYPVRIANPNPKLAAVIISQYGGPDGELGASLRYLSQRYSMPYPELKALLTDIGREASEMFHSEATAFFDAFATV